MTNNRTRQKMFELIRLWQQGNISQKQFCRDKKMPYHVFHYWYRRFRTNEKGPLVEKGVFTPITIEPEPAGFIELHFPDGRRLVFNQKIAPEYLKALLS